MPTCSAPSPPCWRHSERTPTMPTSYTAKVSDGTITTVRAYALECARAFLVEMRDAPYGTPIPRTIAPDTTHDDKEIAAAHARLTELLVMTAEQRDQAAMQRNL